jgi:hypothetical protein
MFAFLEQPQADEALLAFKTPEAALERFGHHAGRGRFPGRRTSRRRRPACNRRGGAAVLGGVVLSELRRARR